ncbi:helix-turn-helix domain-containing protein [Nocardia sp. NPDC019395]|uniref:IclR family transcriptional regulator n=1 Tax=Nocardia sp. NPDC019395 TaxID=3154686 RepID=UPI0033D4D34D
MATSDNQARARGQVGSQTLARGLCALLAVVDSPAGLSVQEIAAHLGVHRSIAYRLLQTLSDYGFVVQGASGSYLPGARLAVMSRSYLPALREYALPVMRELADELGCTVSLFVAEGLDAVSVELVEPLTVSHHLAFRAGMRTPLDRGAAGYVLMAAEPQRPGEPAVVTEVRERGYATSAGEVEPGAFALAALIPDILPRASLAVMSHREEQVLAARDPLLKAAERIGHEAEFTSGAV